MINSDTKIYIISVVGSRNRFRLFEIINKLTSPIPYYLE